MGLWLPGLFGSPVDSARWGEESCVVDASCHQLSGYFGVN